MIKMQLIAFSSATLRTIDWNRSEDNLLAHPGLVQEVVVCVLLRHLAHLGLAQEVFALVLFSHLAHGKVRVGVAIAFVIVLEGRKKKNEGVRNRKRCTKTTTKATNKTPMAT
jgi:hypothetical protein